MSAAKEGISHHLQSRSDTVVGNVTEGRRVVNFWTVEVSGHKTLDVESVNRKNVAQVNISIF